MPNRPWAAGICDGPLGPLLAVPATGKRSSTNGHSACRHVQEDAQIGEDAADGPRPGGGEIRYCLIAVDPYAFAHAPEVVCWLGDLGRRQEWRTGEGLREGAGHPGVRRPSGCANAMKYAWARMRLLTSPPLPPGFLPELSEDERAWQQRGGWRPAGCASRQA